jgi:hypothetical protein
VIDVPRLSAEVGAAIEASVAEDWEEFDRGEGFVFSKAALSGWTIRVGYGGGRQDGTAAKGHTIVHLTPDQSVAARKKAEK